MPERCIPTNKCGTNSPLWLSGPHPKRRQGIVTRQVCGHWKKRCCAFRSTPIQVKKCLGNYYVYKLAPPSSCYLAYCAGTEASSLRFNSPNETLKVKQKSVLMLGGNLKPRMFSDINTLVCGRCRRNQSCVSRDKINWRCKRKKSKSGSKQQ